MRAPLWTDKRCVTTNCIKSAWTVYSRGRSTITASAHKEILRYQAYNKVFGNTAQSEFSEFTLPAPDSDNFTALVFNDLHQHPKTFRALCQQIQDIDYDFVVFNGDCVDDPASHEQATAFISELTEGVHGDCVPTFFMRGNHEIRNAYSIGLRDHYDYVGNKTYVPSIGVTHAS